MIALLSFYYLLYQFEVESATEVERDDILANIAIGSADCYIESIRE